MKAPSGRWTLPIEFSLAGIAARATTVELEFQGFRPTRDSFELRVLLAPPGAASAAQHAGSIFLFGRGDAAPGGPLVPGAADPHAPMTLRVDVTDAIRALPRSASRFSVTLVAVDPKGRELAGPDVEFDSVAVVASD